MKKLLIILAVLIGIIAVGATVFLGKLDGIIADVIRTEGSNAIGTEVSVTSVVTDLKAGSAIINGLAIANPPGYTAQPAFAVDQFKTKIDYKNQTIEEIIIDNPTVNAELIGTQSNFQSLMDNMPESSSAAEPDAVAEDTESEDTIITIKKLAITRTQVNLVSDKLGSQSFTISDLIMTDLTGTPEQLATQVTSKLTQFISAEVKGFAAQALKAKVAEKVAQVKDEAKEKLAEALGSKVGGNNAIGSKLGDKAKGFNFKLR